MPRLTVWKSEARFKKEYEKLSTAYLKMNNTVMDERMRDRLGEQNDRLGDYQKRCWGVESVTMLGFLGAHYQEFRIVSLLILLAGFFSTCIFILVMRIQLYYRVNPTKYICLKIFPEYKLMTRYKMKNSFFGRYVGLSFMPDILLVIWVSFFVLWFCGHY